MLSDQGEGHETMSGEYRNSTDIERWLLVRGVCCTKSSDDRWKAGHGVRTR